MRCLSPSEAEEIFGRLGFSVSLKHAYRKALILADPVDGRQTRIAAEQPSDIGRVEFFVRALNRWLPTNCSRLLWVDHWDTGSFGGQENAIVSAAWRGLGETRSPEDAPGLYLDPQDWDQEDQTEIPASQAEALGILTGVVTTLMITRSDGWLVSEGGTDRIEFWEGHFFFHSADRKQLDRANEIVNEFGCARWKESG
jgi:hypothetical protein